MLPPKLFKLSDGCKRKKILSLLWFSGMQMKYLDKPYSGRIMKPKWWYTCKVHHVKCWAR